MIDKVAMELGKIGSFALPAKGLSHQEVIAAVKLNTDIVTKSSETRRMRGDDGEELLIKSVPCPNCSKELMRLPTNYPLYDVQCTGCAFRAQVKANQTKPKAVIFGAGWQIIEKVMKAGFMIPPLFVIFRWRESNFSQTEIRFYPFIPKRNLRKYTLSPTARRANYKMFLYTGLNSLQHFVVYKSK